MNFIAESEYREKLAASEREIMERVVGIQELTAALKIEREKNAEMRESLAGMVRIVEAMRYSAGLGKNQAERLERAKLLLSNIVMSQPEPSTPKTTSGQAEGLAR